MLLHRPGVTLILLILLQLFSFVVIFIICTFSNKFPNFNCVRVCVGQGVEVCAVCTWKCVIKTVIIKS